MGFSLFSIVTFYPLTDTCAFKLFFIQFLRLKINNKGFGIRLN